MDKLSLVNLVNKSTVDMPIDSRVLNNGEYIELRHCCYKKPSKRIQKTFKIKEYNKVLSPQKIILFYK